MFKLIQKIIRNVINPKVKRPKGCLCPEENFRYFCALYVPECPVHRHHLEHDYLHLKQNQTKE